MTSSEWLASGAAVVALLAVIAAAIAPRGVDSYLAVIRRAGVPAALCLLSLAFVFAP